jgi:hypothetical protein
MKKWFFFFFFFALFSLRAEESFFPEKEDLFISGDRFKEICDFVFEKNVSFDPLAVQKGSLVFVDKDYLSDFFLNLHPKILHPYILVTHNGSYLKGCATPGPYYLFLKEEKIIAWFGNNPNVQHPKVVGLPQGLESLLWKSGNINFYYDALSKTPCEKKHLLYVNFSFRTDPLMRLQLFLTFSNKPFCFSSFECGWENYVQEVCQSKFILCPKGRGGDSFRVWEALMLGCIPVVKSSCLDSLYSDLPVLLVKDWKEISEEFLEKKYAEMKKSKFLKQKLFISYWEKKMKEKKVL